MQETEGFGWIDAEVRKINNMNKKLKSLLVPTPH